MNTKAAVLLFALFVCAAISLETFADEGRPVSVRGLQGKVTVVRDRFGVPHIEARSDHDVFFMHGYIHANDRFFQMDASRRQASGTLAELLGSAALAGDVQLRTLGLRRAAKRSLAATSAEAKAALQAYADGVNAWLAGHALPPEYEALELTKASVAPWTPLDSVAVTKLLAFGLSFDTIDLDNTQALLTYQAVLGAERGSLLFSGDLFRSAPFDPTISIPEGAVSGSLLHRRHVPAHSVDRDATENARRFLERSKDVPFFAPEGRGEGGSNWWLISPAKSASRNAMLASDPHLSLSSPSVFHEVHLQVNGPKDPPMDVYGVGFPGVPCVIHGYNRRIMWGSTVNPMDVTDYYQERIVPDASGRLFTFFRGALEPILVIPETFRVNAIGDGVADTIVAVPPSPGGVPPATLVVPRRNNGPLVTAPSGSPLTAISVQYTGFSATREFETFLRFQRAGSVREFRAALQFFDFGSQNWGYADIDGNIAYFTSGELPLREDLQAGTVDGGIPPYFVRDGTGTLRHEWIGKDARPADQAIPYEILPFAEMPQLVNPERGYIANGNNDPIGVTLDNDPLNKLRTGGGILYLSPGYAIGNRVGRIDRLIRAELARGGRHSGTVSFEDMTRIQSNVQPIDAEVLAPYILRAFDAARAAGAPAALQALAADPRVAEAVGRLRRWDFNMPTGIAEGYDAADAGGRRSKPTDEEVANSVAATIYSVWRGQALKNVIDATLQRIPVPPKVVLPLPPGDRAMIALRHLLESYPNSASGLNFFPAGRDVAVLQSLKDALDLLASDTFASAFGNSTRQDDYRWGKLHRIVLAHPLGAPFSIGPLSIDGGFEVVDASSHNPRAAKPAEFMFASGPSKRFVGEAHPSGIRGVQVIPGGASGTPGTPFFGSQVELWATNDYHQAASSHGDVMRNAVSVEVFAPWR